MFYKFTDVDFGREVVLNRDRIAYIIKSLSKGDTYDIYTVLSEGICISSDTYQALLARLEPIPLVDGIKEG
ncbi:MAG: hypothetical protein DDT41_01772 [candidate division WS2 bacterium]|nr:hypothetical protein [Candidatus Psychracetigena formicireducens]